MNVVVDDGYIGDAHTIKHKFKQALDTLEVTESNLDREPKTTHRETQHKP